MEQKEPVPTTNFHSDKTWKAWVTKTWQLMLKQTPGYYCRTSFVHIPRRKAYIFSKKLTRLKRTLVNTDNGHFSVSRVTNSHVFQLRFTATAVYLCTIGFHCYNYVLIVEIVGCSNTVKPPRSGRPLGPSLAVRLREVHAARG